MVDKAFISNFLEFFQLLFGLSIKSTREIDWLKVTRWNGTEEFWEKPKGFGTVNDKCFFFLLVDFNARADIITRHNLIRLDVFCCT